MPRTRRPRPLAVLAAAVVLVLAGAPAAGATSGGDGVATTAAAQAVAPPPVGARFDYQLGGAYAPAAGVGVVVRDRTAPPAPGRYSVCYVNAFQTQPQEAGWWTARYPSLVLRDGRGRPVEDAGWPGELLLDTRTAATRGALATLVGRWLDGCADKGYRAVELDNLDSWLRSGDRLTTAGNLAYAQLLVRRAHSRGLAVAQKNAAGLTRSQVRTAGFDFAVAEECEAYDECGAYTWVHGRHVLEVEYADGGREAFRAACAARGHVVPVLLRDRDVLPRGQRGHVSEQCP
ncbi:hypothetical protein EDC03_2060 [Pseudokineococcus lusitanus]|uniref:Glycoside-hydrolase family GH114 TIM-barrel domain-containing protein n=1 Tax=Pseudokineococcus lusitanus TaxID=763993 RepID=A0A3N1HJY5_9ACTN|nr:hypothetical protein EDC03_2060 [Pseudokineococcus lusitanus]